MPVRGSSGDHGLLCVIGAVDTHAGTGRIFSILERAVNRHPADVELLEVILPAEFKTVELAT